MNLIVGNTKRLLRSCESHLETILPFSRGQREGLPDPGSVETTHLLCAESFE